MKKPTPLRGSLRREAVNVMQKLTNAGVPENIFRSLSHDFDGSEKLQIGLTVASLARMSKNNFQFTPIALGWKLGSTQAISHSLTFHPHHSTKLPPGPQSQHALNQMQPELDSARISVVQPKYAEIGTNQVRNVFEHRLDPNAHNGEAQLRERKVGLGIAHALEVADKFMFNPDDEVQFLVPLRGSQSIGRCLFILLDYLVFKDFNDLVGKRAFSWLELRIITSEITSSRPSFLTTVHTDLRAVIPAGSLMAVANLSWFKD